MKKFAALVVLFISAHLLFAQQALVNNNGAPIHVKDGAFVIVKTASVDNKSGNLNNDGTIVVEGYMQNEGSITGNGDTIRLFGDWKNNGSYTGTNSWVDLYSINSSANPQLITGSQITTFDNLNLGGGNSTKKQTINAAVSGTLALNSAELATDANEMLVSNTSTTAITRGSGYVSSIGAGKLSRATNVSAAYLFPTGSPSYVNGPSIFRPLDFTPTASNTNIYGAALVKGDATADGYDVKSVDDSLCSVNPNFYHRLYQTSGTDATALAMYFNPATDGDWTDQAHWLSPRWNYLGAPSAGTGLGMSTITVQNVSNFVPEPFALAKKRFVVEAGPDMTINEGASIGLDPFIGTSNYDAVVWTPGLSLSCTDCEKPVATPPTTTQYKITVTDGGCTVSDSLIIRILNTELLVPTAFSPNGDNVNAYFHVLNKNLDKLTLQVFNRWGEKVYETSDPNDQGWDGFYKGIPQELGVYVWQCQYQFTGAPKIHTAKGNVTLVR